MTLLLAFVINRNYKKVNIASGTEEIKFQMSRGTCFVLFFFYMIRFQCAPIPE